MVEKGGLRVSPRNLESLWKSFKLFEHRTSNHAEAANKRFYTEMGVYSPTIWTFINGFERVLTGRVVFCAQSTAGRSPPKKI